MLNQKDTKYIPAIIIKQTHQFPGESKSGYNAVTESILSLDRLSQH